MGWSGQKKNPSRVREVCARVEDDDGRPYLVVRGGHCGPARLLPIIMANESTEAVWHRRSPDLTAVSGFGRPSGTSGRGQRLVEEFPYVREDPLPVGAPQPDRHMDGEAVQERPQPGGEPVGVDRAELAA